MQHRGIGSQVLGDDESARRSIRRTERTMSASTTPRSWPAGSTTGSARMCVSPRILATYTHRVLNRVRSASTSRSPPVADRAAAVAHPGCPRRLRSQRPRARDQDAVTPVLVAERALARPRAAPCARSPRGPAMYAGWTPACWLRRGSARPTRRRARQLRGHGGERVPQCKSTVSLVITGCRITSSSGARGVRLVPRARQASSRPREAEQVTVRGRSARRTRRQQHGHGARTIGSEHNPR